MQLIKTDGTALLNPPPCSSGKSSVFTHLHLVQLGLNIRREVSRAAGERIKRLCTKQVFTCKHRQQIDHWTGNSSLFCIMRRMLKSHDWKLGTHSCLGVKWSVVVVGSRYWPLWEPALSQGRREPCRKRP